MPLMKICRNVACLSSFDKNDKNIKVTNTKADKNLITTVITKNKDVQYGLDGIVFDKDGKFLFQQAEEGDALATGNYQMSVALPLGEYKLMAWAGVHDSYDVPQLAPGASITELELKLKRASSLVIDKALEPLWYGEINEVNFTGNMNLVETINLIKNTNTVRFIFQQPENSGGGFAVDDS